MDGMRRCSSMIDERWWLSGLTGLALLVGGCASTPEANLYQALGEQAGIESLVNEAVRRSHNDPRFGEVFVEADLDNLRTQLNDQICELADGPCTYTGLSMAEAHSGMQISRAEFNWFVEHTRDAMTALGYSVGTQNRLLARLAPMRTEILSETDMPAQMPEEPVDPLGMGEDSGG